jgi:hypothetical protein
VLRLGCPLAEGSVGTLAEASLFLAIMGIAWATHGGHQCWRSGSPIGKGGVTREEGLRLIDASGEVMLFGHMGTMQLGFHK